DGVFLAHDAAAERLFLILVEGGHPNAWVPPRNAPWPAALQAPLRMFEPALAARLRELARGEDATLFHVLMAAFRVVLARHAGQSDVVIGTPVANRQRSALEGLIGFFVNTVPLRGRVDDGASFRARVRAEKAAALAAFNHGELPFDRMVDELRVPRDPGRNPVFQAMLALQNARMDPLALPGAQVTPLDTASGTARFELTLDNWQEEDGGIDVRADFASALFEAATVERIVGHFVNLLRQAVAAPDVALAELPLATPEELAAVAAWGRSSEDLVRAGTLHGIVAAQAARTPGAQAVAWDGGALTYAELDARAAALARRLRGMGVGPERVVGMMLAPSPEAIAAILGILKAGGAYLPLDPAHPDTRIAHALADSGAIAIVARTADAGRIAHLPVISIDSLRSFTETEDGEDDEARRPSPPGPLPQNSLGEGETSAYGEGVAPEAGAGQRSSRSLGLPQDDRLGADAGPENLAYVIYTSGSTGAPKGVAVAHGAAALHVHGAARTYGFRADDRMLAFSSLTFDASVEHLFATFAAGACVVPRTEVWGPAELARLVERLGVTALLTSAGYWTQLAHDAAALSALRGRLRLVTAGGEEMRRDAVEEWTRVPGGAEVLNVYGPTEAIITATYFPASPEFAASRPARVPIGAPLPGHVLHVLDDALRPVGAGIPGELCVGGIALARGYLNRPALTAERFVPDPYAGVPGTRMYRTGDRVRWCESARVRECESDSAPRAGQGSFAPSHSRTGLLEFLGRADEQVKVRGFRIELGEVEAALRAHPDVADCAVDARPDASGSLSLAAWIVAHDGAAPDVVELRAHLASRLPEYMLPAAFVALDALPLTTAGKVDRRALPQPSGGGATASAEPETADEAALAAIWAELLRVERVGVDDDFVSLGGHSLLGVRVISRIAARLGVELPLRAIFEAPTVRALARRVAQARGEAGAAPAGPIPRADRSAPLPASFAQERMWFLQQLDPQSPAYNVPVALRLRGALDADALRGAVAEVVRRHEVLRTAFRGQGPGDRGQGDEGEAGFAVEQVILREDAFGWGFADLSHLPHPDAGAEAMRRARADAAAPFDLGRGPVLRAELLRIADDEHLLSLSMHHVAGDAWAWEVMNRELAALYAAFRHGGASPLPPLEVQYADFAAWQRGWLRGEVLERQAAFWRERLAGAPAMLELPTDRPHPAVQDLRGTLHAFRIPADAAQAARALATREGATPFMVLLAAFAVVLHRWSGEEDLVVGTPVTSRPRPELEPLIGFFSNTLPVRADLSGRPAFRDVLRRVRETTIDAFAHQDLPFEKLVDEVKAERSLSHTPLFQVMFSLRHAAGTELALEGVAAEDVALDSGTSRYDLTVILSDAADGALDGFAEFAAALWDEATIARMMRHLESVVRAAAAAPDAPVATLPLLDADERTELVDGFNLTDRQWDAAFVHEIVARQAARTPYAVAVEHGGERVTYAELETRANRLAHRLARLGVGPDARVAVAMERSVEMVVAVLAVLKAGGCYVAVDPAYPADRVAYMLADSRAAVVLTTSDVADRLPSTDAAVVRVDVEELSSEPTDAPRVDLHPENLLYVLYTSGSTGRPKGAALPHRALANVVRWQVERFGDGGDQAGFEGAVETAATTTRSLPSQTAGGGSDQAPARAAGARTLQFASLSFDVSFQEIFSTWTSGGTLVLIDDDTRRDAEALLAHLREHRIERLFIPFAGLQGLAEIAEAGDRGQGTGDSERASAHLPHLREVITAGEALRSTPQLRAFFRANPQASLDNHYGPSETHVISAHLVAGDPEAWPALPPIGAPVANTRLYVLDAEMQPTPVGVPGELYAGGVHLARGYLDRAALTAEKFVFDPFGPAGRRLYRTGDRVKWRADGVLEYVGRTDFQVKIRGFRVEPGEVEAVLTEHPAVVQAAVTARGEGAERRLAAYVVPAAGASPTVAELRAHVAARLPEHMVPRAWRVMDALPLTPSGKVDRRALPEPDAAPADDARIEPRTPVEVLVA
ncbi:MAG TPA: amino acid adenylation domain-containing protein, partial [Longimicrobium sp.]